MSPRFVLGRENVVNSRSKLIVQTLRAMFVDILVMSKYCVASVMSVYLPATLTGNGHIPNMKSLTIKQMILESSKLT